MGCIYRRGKQGWYSILYYLCGKRYVESTGSASYENAKTLLRRREGDIARGIPVTPAVGKLRFEQARDDLLNYQRVNRRPGIKKLERRIALHLEPRFGRMKMVDIT